MCTYLLEHTHTRSLSDSCGVWSRGVQRVVTVLLPVSGVVDLAVGMEVGWGWGIMLGLLSLAMSMALAYNYKELCKVHQAADSKRVSAQAHDKSLTKLVLTSTQRFASVVFPYIFLTALVQVVPQGREPQWLELRSDGFPTGCRSGAQNCVRLGNGTDIYAAGQETDMVPPVLSGSRAQVLEQVQAWVLNQGGRVVFRSPTVVRAIFVTPYMGYTDDLAATASCLPDLRTQVNLQSQSRLGIGDMGVNARRLQSMIDFLKYACPPGGLRDRAEARFKWEKAQGAEDANAYQAADQMLESMARRREAQVQVSGKGEKKDREVVGRVRRKEGLVAEKSRCDAHCV